MLSNYLATVFYFLTVLAMVSVSGRKEDSGNLIEAIDDTFFMSKEMKHHYRDKIIKKSDRDREERTPWYEGEDVTLPNETHACPWSFVSFNNKNRIPYNHTEVECLIPICLSFESNHTDYVPNGRELQANKKLNDAPGTMCTQVFAYKWVQARKKEGYKFEKRLLEVAVGCTCIHETPPKP